MDRHGGVLGSRNALISSTPARSMAGPGDASLGTELGTDWMALGLPASAADTDPDPSFLLDNIFSGTSDPGPSNDLRQAVSPRPHPTAPLLDMLDDLLKQSLQRYFQCFHSLRPITNRDAVMVRFAIRDHLFDPQFAALILSLSSLALVTTPGQETRADSLIQEAMKLHNGVNLGLDVTLETLATSMSIAAFLGATRGRRVAQLRLKESIALAQTLGLDSSEGYEKLSPTDRPVAVTCFWLLTLAERSSSLFQPGSITLKGKPSDIVGRSVDSSDYNKDLRPLVRIWDVMDEELLDCVNDQCRGRCRFDAVRAVTSQRALDLIEPSDSTGDVQLADFHISRLWLKTRLWQACLAHMLLQATPVYPELGLDYPLTILAQLNDVVTTLSLSALGGNGQAIVRVSLECDAY